MRVTYMEYGMYIWRTYTMCVYVCALLFDFAVWPISLLVLTGALTIYIIMHVMYPLTMHK